MARIAFISPSLAQHHGIGDYVRLLTKEAVLMGHEVIIITLNEPHVHDSWNDSVQVGDKTIPAYRHGQHMDYAVKCRQARPLLDAFKPDWVSLQFEFYCYAWKGSLLGLLKNLPPLLAGYRIHVMMHELWVQLHAGGDIKEQIKGTIRYFQCRQLFKKIKPIVAHTSVEPYAKGARRLFPKIKLLSVPSNIPVYRGELPPMPPEVAATMTESKLRSSYLLVILFGRIIPEWDGRGNLKQIDEFAKHTSKLVRLISIGSCGYHDQYWKQLSEQVPANWQAIKLGPREPDFISQTLQMCDLAVSCTPFSLFRKSGTTAAFLEHGLPVLFADKKPTPQEITAISSGIYMDQFYFGDEALPLEMVTRPHVLANEAYSAQVTRQFIDDLHAAE